MNTKNREEAIIELSFRNDNVEEQVEVLAAVSASGAPGHSQAADIAIENMRDQALPFLEKYFKDPIELEESGEVKNLADVRMKRVLGCTLIRVLGGEESDKYFPRLKELLKSNDKKLLRCGLFALRSLPDRAKECEPELAELLVELPKSKAFDFNNQIAICQLAMSADLKSKEMEAAVQKMLVDGLPSVRGWCGVCLGGFADSPSGSDNAKLLADRIENDHLLVVHQLLVGIAKLGPKAAPYRDVVLEKTSHRDPYARSAAKLAIARIDNDPKVLRAEVRKLLKQTQSEQLGINMAMEMGDDAAQFVDDFLPLTSNEDAIVRESVAIALGELGAAAKPALLRLQPLTRDRDPLVRHAAIKAIEKIKSASESK